MEHCSTEDLHEPIMPTRSPWFTLGFTLGGLDGYVTTWVHMIVTYRVVSLPRYPPCSTCFPSPPYIPGNHWSFDCSRVSSSGDQTVPSLSDWLLPPNTMRFSFLVSFRGSLAPFFLVLKTSVCPSTSWRASALLLGFGRYERSCRAGPRAGFCVDIRFPFGF